MDQFTGVSDAPYRSGPAPRSVALSGIYDPAVQSEGLTVDSPLGPVDTIAVDRARRGFPTPLSPADWFYLLRTDGLDLEVLSASLGIRPGSVRRAIERARAEWAVAS